MSRSLDDLSSACRPLAVELLARLVEAGILVLIVDTLRTEAEQQIAIATGHSMTARSRHLPRGLRRFCLPGDPDQHKADAMDVCPYALYQLHGPDKLQWDDTDPAWAVIGHHAEALGFVWGGRWTMPHDPGHVEVPWAVWDR